MTRFTVVWVSGAHDELIELWLEMELKTAVAEAVDQIDADLSVDPMTKGEDLAEGLRWLAVSPVKVIFAVVPDDRRVEVLRVCWL